MKSLRKWFVLALGATLFVLAGCGAGDSAQAQPGDYGGPPTKAPPGAGN